MSTGLQHLGKHTEFFILGVGDGGLTPYIKYNLYL